MKTCNPSALAAELRLRAATAEPRERDELLFLADEYERMAQVPGPGRGGFFLPD